MVCCCGDGLVLSRILSSFGIDLDLAVKRRRIEEIFSVCLFDRVHCLQDVTEYDGGQRPYGARGCLLGVSKHKTMLPNLMGKGGGLDCLMEHSLSSSVTRGNRGYPPCPLRLKPC